MVIVIAFLHLDVQWIAQSFCTVCICMMDHWYRCWKLGFSFTCKKYYLVSRSDKLAMTLDGCNEVIEHWNDIALYYNRRHDDVFVINWRQDDVFVINWRHDDVFKWTRSNYCVRDPVHLCIPWKIEYALNLCQVCVCACVRAFAYLQLYGLGSVPCLLKVPHNNYCSWNFLFC